MTDWVERHHQEQWTGKKYNPQQPRWPKGTPRGGQWTRTFAGARFRITSTENTLAKGDDTELYRWSNLGEIRNAGLNPTRHPASLDVTDKPFWYFSPPKLESHTGKGWPDRTYGRVILDREKLREAGWRRAEGLEAEGAWLWNARNIGKTWQDFPDASFKVQSYLDAIQGYEVMDLPEGSTMEDVRDMLSYALGREVPVMHTTLLHMTEPFQDQNKHPWWPE